MLISACASEEVSYGGLGKEVVDRWREDEPFETIAQRETLCIIDKLRCAPTLRERMAVRWRNAKIRARNFFRPAHLRQPHILRLFSLRTAGASAKKSRNGPSASAGAPRSTITSSLRNPEYGAFFLQLVVLCALDHETHGIIRVQVFEPDIRMPFLEDAEDLIRETLADRRHTLEIKSDDLDLSSPVRRRRAASGNLRGAIAVQLDMHLRLIESGLFHAHRVRPEHVPVEMTVGVQRDLE